MSSIDKSESEIIKGCIKQDRRAQKSLYQLFYTKMCSVSYRYTNSYDDAKDLVQDAFIHIFNKIEKFKGEGSLEGWIRRIVVNKSIDFINKKNKVRVYISSDEQRLLHDTSTHEAYLREEDEDDFSSIYTSNLSEEDILEAIDSLKEAYKVIFNLNVIDQFSHREIAEKLGITEELSRIRLKRGRAALQSILLGIATKKKQIQPNEF